MKTNADEMTDALMAANKKEGAPHSGKRKTPKLPLRKSGKGKKARVKMLHGA